MLFAGLLTAAMAVACEMLQKPRPGPILRVAFGFFLGAAVLAKGPAAVILAGGATLLWAALSRQWRAPFRFLHPLVIAVFCATALPWYVLCALRNPDFLRVFIWQHNFERYLTPVFEHRQPFWYFGYILLLAVFPWILFLGAAFFGAFSRLKNKAAFKSIDTFFACWALFPILFFSLSQSKLPGYILPAIPPLFLLFGQWVSSAMALKTRSVLRVLGWTGGLFLLAAIPLATSIIHGVNKMPAGYVPTEFAVFLFGIVVVALVLKSRPREALLSVALFAIVTVEIANFSLLPGLDSQFSARPLAVKILKTDPAGENVAVYRLPRATEYGMNFYLNHDLREWTPGSPDPEWILAGHLLPGGMLHSGYEFYLDDSRKVCGLPPDVALRRGFNFGWNSRPPAANSPGKNSRCGFRNCVFRRPAFRRSFRAAGRQARAAAERRGTVRRSKRQAQDRQAIRDRAGRRPKAFRFAYSKAAHSGIAN